MKNKLKKQKGSMLVAVLIIMFMVAAIAISLIQRSIQGFNIVGSSEKSYISYQQSDSGAERFLTGLKNQDSLNNGNIPENISATDFCSNFSGLECFSDLEGENPVVNSSRVSDILSVKQEGEESGVFRAVVAPTTTRVNNPISALRAERCDVGVEGCLHPNKCDIKLSWSIGDVSRVSALEIRRSNQNNIGRVVSGTFTYGWRIAKGTTSSQKANPTSPTTTNFIVENGDNFLAPDAQEDIRYYFTVKAKNKNNYELDSLYSAVEGVGRMLEDDCEGGGLVLPGCRDTKPDNAQIVSDTAYNCCNGTECYRCRDGFVPNADKTACRQP